MTTIRTNKKPIFANQNQQIMIEFSKKCFVCKSDLNEVEFSFNQEINLPVCNKCKNTDNEKEALKNLIEGLADGFVCGCI